MVFFGNANRGAVSLTSSKMDSRGIFERLFEFFAFPVKEQL
jgi:hypothetical protein